MFVLILFSCDIFAKSAPLSYVTSTNHDIISKSMPSFIYYYKAKERQNEMNKVEFEIALDSLGEYGITAAEVDCDTFGDICKKLNIDIRNLPVLRANIISGPSIYSGNFNDNEIIKWVDSICGKTLRVFKTERDAQALFTKFNQVTIGYFDSRESFEFKVYQSIAHNPQEKEVYAAVISEEYFEPLIKHIQPRDDIIDVYKGPWEWQPMISFLQDVRFPLIDEISGSNAEHYFKSGKPLGYFFYDTKTSPFSALNIKNEGFKVAKKFKGRMLFVLVDHAVQARLVHSLGLLPEHLPGFTIEAPFPSPDPEAKAHYPILVNRPLNFQGSDMHELVVPHIEKFLNKTLPLKLRSVPQPENQTHPVVTVVGDSFNKTVIDNDRYVFVKFTMPWCANCKRLKPEFEKIAEEIVSDPRVVLAEFDCSHNDYWPAYFTGGYPTLLLFSPPNKDRAKKCEEFYSPMKIRRFLKDNVPDLKIDVDYEAIAKEDEKRVKEKEEEERKKKKGGGGGGKGGKEPQDL